MKITIPSSSWTGILFLRRSSTIFIISPPLLSHHRIKSSLTTELNHRTELIKHLLEFSNQLLIVTAPVGSGVSSLINNVVDNVEENWLFSLVLGDGALKADSFCREIIKGVIDKNSL